MESNQWNRVLVEWVNCLKLAKSIQNLEELKGNDFFCNIQKVITKSLEPQNDILTFIFNLLDKHYPQYSIKNQSEIHLSDLPNLDLKAITSLLMHYTCIYDRRDVLTSPLCHSLSQPTQLVIKTFLERMNSSVSNETLEDIIKQCIYENNTDHFNDKWMTMGHLESKSSPLLHLLKTPVSKYSRLQEKDRTIRKLKSEIEAERYEKAELQEELKLEIQNNKKLENKLKNKILEISRLRDEIASLDAQSASNFKETDSRELNKRLKTELESLQLYSQQIECAQDDLVKEKDFAKEKLRCMETQCTIWQEKFLETEQNYQMLSEQFQQQDEELKNLKSHCSELTVLLEEYRSKSKNDSSSLYESFDVGSNKTPDKTQSCEDLACSVVEVQLREAQTQNAELQTKIKKVEEYSAELNIRLSELSSTLCTTEDKLNSLSILKEDLQEKLQAKEAEYNATQQVLNETRDSLHELTEICKKHCNNLNNKEDECEKLNEALKTSSCLLHTTQEEKENLERNLHFVQEKLVTVGAEISQLKLQIQETNTLFEAERTEKMEELNILKEKYDRNLEKLHNTQHCLTSTAEELMKERESHTKLQTDYKEICIRQQSLQDYLKIYEEANEDLRRQLQNLQVRHAEEVAQISLSLQTSLRNEEEWKLKNENLKRKVTTLESECCNWKENFSILEEECGSLKQREKEQQEHIVWVNSCLDELKKELEYTRNQHKESMEEVNTLQAELTKLMNIQDCLTSKLKAFAEIDEQFEKLKIEFQELHAKCEELERIVLDLNNNLKVVNNSNETLAAQLELSEISVKKLETRSENFQKDIVEKDNLLCQSQTDIQGLKNSLTDIQMECSSLKHDIAAHVVQNNALELQVKAAESNFLRSEENNARLTKIIEQRDSCLHTKENEIMKIKEALKECNEKCNALNCDINTLKNLNNDLSTQTEKMGCNLLAAEEQICSLRSQIAEKSNEIFTNGKEINNLNEALKTSYGMCESLQNSTEVLCSEKEAAKKTLEAVELNLQKLSAENATLRADIQNKSDICIGKQKDIDELLEALRDSNERCIGFQDSFETLQNKGVLMNMEMEKLKSKLAQSERQIQELVCQIKDKNNVLSNLQSDISETLKTLEEKSSECSTIRTYLESARSENTTLKMQLETETVNLQKVNEENTVLKQHNKESNELLDKKVKENKNLMNSFNETNEQFCNLKMRVDEVSNNNNCLQTQNSALQDELNSTKHELELGQQNLVLSQRTIDTLHKELDEIKTSVEVYEKELGNYMTQNRTLTDQIENESNMLKNCQLEIQTLQQCTTDLQLQKEILENKLTQRTSELSQNELLQQDSKNQIVELNLQVQHLEAEKEKLLRKIQDLEFQGRICENKISEVEIKVGVANNHLREKDARLEEEAKSLKQVRSELESVTLQFQETHAICMGLIKDNEDLLTRVQVTQREKQHLEDVSKETLRTLQTKVDALAEENVVLRNEIKDFTSVEAAKIAANQSLEDKVQDYEIAISGLKNVVENNLETLESLREEKGNLIEKLKAVDGEMLKMKKNQEHNYSVLCRLLGSAGDSCENLEFSSLVLNVESIVNRMQISEKRIVELLDTIGILTRTNSTFLELLKRIDNLVSGKSEDTQIECIEKLDTYASELCSKIEEKIKFKESISKDVMKLQQEKQESLAELNELKTSYLKVIKEKIEQEGKVEELQNKLYLEKRSKCETTVKSEKENILSSSKLNIERGKEDEWKKKNMMLKQKLVLTENAKSNLEKKIKQLREENKTLKEASSTSTTDVHYKNLLQEYIQLKEEHEQTVKEQNAKYAAIVKELDELKKNNGGIQIKTEEDAKLQDDLNNLKHAYGNVVSNNSKLELENVTLRRVISQRNTEIGELSLIKEAYEKLLEDNNKLMTEVDTIKYKRNRDKDEFVRLLKKERSEAEERENQRVVRVRVEMEEKLQQMKEKMLKLFREEVQIEKLRMKAGQCENGNLVKIIGGLEQKVHLLEMERDILKTKAFDSSSQVFGRAECSNVRDRNSIRSLDSRLGIMNSTPLEPFVDKHTAPRRDVRIKPEEVLRASTLPRTIREEDVDTSKKTSVAEIGHNPPMEDEDDMFNNKYLTDLKEGRCILPSSGRDSVNSRFSELTWRNSMVPQHLKSSYPAETQFYSPSNFKEEDIKEGRLEFENSSSRLLPGEKPRRKDFGTTSYKKPGPPTPVKNGGRLSLQGNEVHPLREPMETKTPKRITPSRIRALFTSKNSTKESSESHNGTPSRTRRLNIFRKPR